MIFDLFPQLQDRMVKINLKSEMMPVLIELILSVVSVPFPL